jgi:uncharacterized membrane protein YkvA (DUF1232 family)
MYVGFDTKTKSDFNQGRYVICTVSMHYFLYPKEDKNSNEIIELGQIKSEVKLFSKLKQKAKELKSESQVLLIAYRDPGTPLLAKILIGFTIAYLLSPIDLIPDFIPVLGLLDDLVIVPLLITFSVKLIPEKILEEARQKAKSNPEILRKTNWIFAILIIILWLMILYFVVRRLS